MDSLKEKMKSEIIEKQNALLRDWFNAMGDLRSCPEEQKEETFNRAEQCRLNMADLEVRLIALGWREIE